MLHMHNFSPQVCARSIFLQDLLLSAASWRFFPTQDEESACGCVGKNRPPVRRLHSTKRYDRFSMDLKIARLLSTTESPLHKRGKYISRRTYHPGEQSVNAAVYLSTCYARFCYQQNMSKSPRLQLMARWLCFIKDLKGYVKVYSADIVLEYFFFRPKIFIMIMVMFPSFNQIAVCATMRRYHGQNLPWQPEQLVAACVRFLLLTFYCSGCLQSTKIQQNTKFGGSLVLDL